MNKMELRAAADKARECVSVELWMNDAPLGHIQLDAGSLESFIHDLGKHRAALADEVSAEIDPGSRLESIVDPAWRTFDQHSQQELGVALSLRHPGLGWLSFLLPHKSAALLGQWLVDHSKRSAPDSSYPSESS